MAITPWAWRSRPQRPAHLNDGPERETPQRHGGTENDNKKLPPCLCASVVCFSARTRMTAPDELISRADGPAWRLTINHPARRNALSPELAESLAREIERVSASDAVRV